MKIDRLLAIVTLLLGRDRISGKELAERFEVSVRTICRDIDAINKAGIPIVSYTGNAGGYGLIDHYKLDRQLLTFEELFMIETALNGMLSSMDDQKIQLLMDKVQALIVRAERDQMQEHKQKMIVDFNPWGHGRSEQDIIEQLRGAIKDNLMVEFDYPNSIGEYHTRKIEPMTIALKGYHWYVYGYCTTRNNYRIFRLSRINNLRIALESFVRRDKTIEDFEDLWNDRGPVTHLELHFQPKVRTRVQDYFKAESITPLPDGSLQVKGEFLEDSWLYDTILSFGPNVLVLEPEHIRAEIADRVRRTAQLYDK
ncbi:helix-turn-helix transcriptional regulator [Paenibacillus favisporus]|uniref:helix-turn-helix transcriptional regulator n=1 Tax=Paenibacillus favisporus TaxID=221028 RepID=UPI0013D02C02|nr:YafY family protein [Paenibacillus favisporus]